MKGTYLSRIHAIDKLGNGGRRTYNTPFPEDPGRSSALSALVYEGRTLIGTKKGRRVRYGGPLVVAGTPVLVVRTVEAGLYV